MTRVMNRGKQQIMFRYLPNNTFDFEGIASIARISTVSGEQRTNLNLSIILRRITEEAYAWQEVYRPALRNDVLRQVDRFVLIDPTSAHAELYPKVLWCQNSSCGAVFDYQTRDTMPTTCPTCRQGKLIQLRFIRIHRCGALKPLLPPMCRNCGTSQHMCLDTRKSERISNFKWVCRHCNTSVSLFSANCNECQWPDPSLQRMDIEVHRAGRTFYAHSTVLLNVPHSKYDSFFGIPEWPAIAAAKFLGMREVVQHPLSEYIRNVSSQQNTQSTGLSGEDLDDLMRRQMNGELTPEQFVQEMQRVRERRSQEQNENSPSGIAQQLYLRTGVPQDVWDNAGQEMFESIMPIETGHPEQLEIENEDDRKTQIAKQMGVAGLSLVSDYPIINATYGFSRVEYQPNECRLNPFPPDNEHNGKFPIYVDQIQADAILINLDPDRVIAWLERNGCIPNIPSGSDRQLARKAYFVQLLNDVPLRATIMNDYREARMVFGLVHTFSHLAIRQAALLCGLDCTSLSEYLLPRTLTFAIYCNHRFGATIGALTSLYQQSLFEWLNAIKETRRCVYDPVCRDESGNCHACTHLAETSCRYFNLNLSRAFLFGGYDKVFGEISVGYFDPSLSQE